MKHLAFYPLPHFTCLSVILAIVAILLPVGCSPSRDDSAQSSLRPVVFPVFVSLESWTDAISKPEWTLLAATEGVRHYIAAFRAPDNWLVTLHASKEQLDEGQDTNIRFELSSPERQEFDSSSISTERLQGLSVRCRIEHWNPPQEWEVSHEHKIAGGIANQIRNGFSGNLRLSGSVHVLTGKKIADSSTV
ncbi:MAG: hypothetical protein RBU25_05775, partial [Lentisphaeria bacterium]|nr:hypothetical protein [Lentisphaeria bacterium]